MKTVLRWIVLVWTVCAIPGTLTNDVSTLFFGLLFEGLIIGLMISDLTKGK